MTKEEAKEILEEVKVLDDSMYQYNERYLQALDMAIKALEQTDVLDKIRAEIEHAYEDLDGYDCNALPTYIGRVLAIIDKYREEQTNE